jgi:hypothetical protein
VLSDDVDPQPPEGESQDVAWFPLTEAIARADAALVDGLLRLARAIESPGRPQWV